MRLLSIFFLFAIFNLPALSQSVKDDPLLRMPGTQPEQAVNLESPGRCLNCHAGYNTAVEPGHNWQGSMMAQAARDFLFWSCLTVSAQDAAWAIGNKNATDLCLRCHMPKGWLAGRSDPTNASAMQPDDFDGVQCDFCHRMYDPFFTDTHAGLREGNEPGYWDETQNSNTPSASAAFQTLLEDAQQADLLNFFNATPFYNAASRPQPPNYTEAGSGQYFVSSDSAKRASFADAAARHQMLYSRFHKSKYFCATCHDVSNPVLANLAHAGTPPGDGSTVLPTESTSAYAYFHVERTFSEFMLSAYGQQGGAPGSGPFDPSIFQTSDANNFIAKCQDCHMRDVVGAACNKTGVPNRPDESTEHPQSGQPLHDLTGGNVWVSTILASTVPTSPNFDTLNAQLLGQGPAVLTLDLSAGLGIDPVALLDGASRAHQQLEMAAAIEGLTYDSATGAASFRVVNQTGHRLISGFPEGRRMFVNIRLLTAGNLMHEVNPYDAAIGTLKGLNHPTSPALGPNETYDDHLVYELHPGSSLTGETESFHFVLADRRYKDNRIPPKGFRIDQAAARHSVPVWHGVEDANYFTAAEYAGGYDAHNLSLPAGADGVEVSVYYQTTSREYIEFLRDEIKGQGNLTLPASAYIAQTDPWFGALAAWGDTIWQLWLHNKDQPGAAPILMTRATSGDVGPPCSPPQATLLSATAGRREVTLTWADLHSQDPNVVGYALYYDQGGKAQLLATPGLVTSYTDTGLTRGVSYCYKVSARYASCEGSFSNTLCATP